MRLSKGKIALMIISMLLALVLCIQIGAVAANSIRVDETCSLTVNIWEQGDEEVLRTAPVKVHIFRVADMDENGTVTPVSGFTEFDMKEFNEYDLEENEGSAEALASLATRLEKYVRDNNFTADISVDVTGSEKIEDLQTGLYLVLTDQLEIDDTGYSFSPYLISLPATDETDDGSFPLIYDVETNLKKEKVQLYGSIVIEKLLSSYRSELGDAMFVFDVEAVKEGKTVYSNVVTLSFDGVGTKRATIDRIPIGATVTVSEVYTGGYEPVGATVKTAEITDGEETVVFDFENKDGGRLIESSGIINRFTYTETEGGLSGWRHEKAKSDED